MIQGLRLIGLTGGIGSGKSTVARLLAERGVPVIDADQVAREVVEPGQPGLAEIAAKWPDVIAADGRLDRRRLGKLVFGSTEARQALERILHPRIVTLSNARAAEFAATGHDLAFYEAALLIETGRFRELDGLVVVDAPEATRIQRIMARDGSSESDVRARLAAQMPAAEKRSFATFVIENDGDVLRLAEQVEQLLADLRQSRSL